MSSLAKEGSRAKQALEARRISRAFEHINPHLYTVEQRILDQAKTFDPGVEGYVAYACESRGKRLRPSLALLTAGATGEITPGHIDLAVILELVHVATLVHDDILDGAERRRGQPTTNAKWGNTISVLLGDCLFAHALRLAAAFHNTEISRKIAHAAADVCSGEILQSQREFDLKLTIADYFRIIEMKTAVLFAVATELGAFLNEADPDVIATMKRFGMKVGTAYQIYDDCVDIAGNEGIAGKTLRTDLRKGKLTLPVLCVLKNASPATRGELHDMILREDGGELESLAARVSEHGGLNLASAAGLKNLSEAEEHLRVLPTSRSKSALNDLLNILRSLFSQFSDA